MNRQRFLNLLNFIFVTLAVVACNEDTIDPQRTGDIAGVILQSSNGQPLGGVTITTSPPSDALVTGEDGAFNLTTLSVGNYAITADKEGYTTKAVNVSVLENKATEVVILLSKGDGSNSRLMPASPLPEDQASGQPISLRLSWSSDSLSDSLTYDVILYESNSGSRRVLVENHQDTTLFVEGLNYNTTYFWQVIVQEDDNMVQGEVWTFKTQSSPERMFIFAREAEGNFDIYTLDTLGDNLNRVTFDPGRDWYPQLSPHRNRIAYSSNRSVDPHIFVMDLDGSNKQQVTNLPIAGYHNSRGIGFSWSPDGEQIIYSHYRSLYKIDRNGSNLTLVSEAPVNRHYRETDWTAVDDKIVALAIGEKIYDAELYLMNSDGSNTVQILGNQPGILASPTFSIDGTQIMFTRDVSGFQSAEGRQLDSRIFIMNRDGSGMVDLSLNKPDGTNDLYPTFTKDGAHILFVNAVNDGLGDPDIWIMDRNGENRQMLIPNATMPD